MKYNEIIRDGDGYAEAAIWADENGARIDEIEPDDKGRRFKIVKIEPDTDEIKALEIITLKNFLNSTDWIVIKLIENQITGIKGDDLEKYRKELSDRAAARERINELEGDGK